MNTNTKNQEVTPRVLLQQPTFPNDWLEIKGFSFVGYEWGNENEPYHSISIGIGELYIVSGSDVYLHAGCEIQRVRQLETRMDLSIFLSLLK